MLDEKLRFVPLTGSAHASQGAGLLLAESVVGARNALHSKAPRLLAMLFAEDVVKASELKTEKVRLPGCYDISTHKFAGLLCAAAML